MKPWKQESCMKHLWSCAWLNGCVLLHTPWTIPPILSNKPWYSQPDSLHTLGLLPPWVHHLRPFLLPLWHNACVVSDHPGAACVTFHMRRRSSVLSAVSSCCLRPSSSPAKPIPYWWVSLHSGDRPDPHCSLSKKILFLVVFLFIVWYDDGHGITPWIPITRSCKDIGGGDPLSLA